MLRRAQAYPLAQEPGIQLWTVQEELRGDTPGTLRKLYGMGFRKLELYTPPPSPKDYKKLLDDIGLSAVSMHVYLQSLRDDRMLEVAHALGMKYLIVVFPTLRSIKDKDISNLSVKELTPLYENITLDDYRWNAERFNEIGERLNRAGLQLGYHNHAVDLKRLDGTVALEELIVGTRPELVVFELDCGHVIHAGDDPIRLLKKYPTRIQLLHLKDLKPGYGISNSIDTEDKDTNAEIGAGVIDWPKLFFVAARGNVKQWFIEHEGPMDQSHLVAAQRSLAFLRQIQ